MKYLRFFNESRINEIDKIKKNFESVSIDRSMEDLKDSFSNISDEWNVNFYFSSAHDAWVGIPLRLKMLAVFNGNFRSVFVVEITCKEKIHGDNNNLSIQEVLDLSEGHQEASNIFKLSGEALLRSKIDIKCLKIDCRRSYPDKIIIVIGII